VTLSGNGLNKAGAGVLTLQGPVNLGSGDVTVSAGTLVLPATGVTAGNLGGAAGTTLTLNGTLTLTGTGSTTFAGTLGGAGGLTRAAGATGTLALSGTNTAYAGAVTVNAGTVSVGTIATNLGSGGITLNGGSPAGTVQGVNVLGTGTGHQIMNSNTTTASTVNLSLPADATFPGAIGGNIVFNKNDTFILQLTGTSLPAATTTGVINVNAGTLQ